MAVHRIRDVEALLLDIDGTVIITDDRMIAAWEEWCREPQVRVDRALVQDMTPFRGRRVPEIMDELTHQRFDTNTLQTMADRFWLSQFEKRDGVQLVQGAKQLYEQFFDLQAQIDRLNSVRETLPGDQIVDIHPLQVGYNTGAMREIVNIFPELGLPRVPHHLVVGAQDVANGKPSPEGHLALMKRMGVTDPQRCIGIGDAGSDARAAKAAGCKTIGIRTSAPDGSEALSKLQVADLVVDDLSGLQLQLSKTGRISLYVNDRSIGTESSLHGRMAPSLSL